MSPSPKYRRKLKAGEILSEPASRRRWVIKPLDTLWIGLILLLMGALCGLAIQTLFATLLSAN